ncbi:MAG: alpha/beta hydrolase [Chitinophagaceae bacterium]|nr:alpha/beta hydrolase [Chitinophagaceae bacterium]
MACQNNEFDSPISESEKNNATKNVGAANLDSSSGYILVNGLQMYYEQYGDGEPLVLIHGGGSTIHTTFGHILPFLAPHYKVIGVELQAHGHTADRNQPTSFEQDADDVAALLHELKIAKANLFGFSNGANTALQIAIRHPDIVDRMIIVSAVYKRSGLIDGFFDAMNNASLENMPKPLQEEYLRITNDPIGLQAMHDRDKFRMIEFKDWDEKNLSKINATTLVVAADHDVIRTEHTVELAKLIPHSQLMILPGLHGASIGERCTFDGDTNSLKATAIYLRKFLDAPSK